MAKRYDIGLTDTIFKDNVLVYAIITSLHEIIKVTHNYFPNNITISNNNIKLGTRYDWYEKI